MGIAAPNLAKPWTSDDRPKQSVFVVLRIVSVSTVIAFAIIDLLYYVVALQLQVWFRPRTEFAFALPSHNYAAMVVGVLIGLAILRSRTWVIPCALGFVLYLLTFPVTAWSGPEELYDAVRPLAELQFELVGIALVINAALLIFWVRREKLRALASQASLSSALIAD